MNWENYLSENKSPVSGYAHLGVLEGQVNGIFDLSKLPANTKVLDLFTPLKKFKKKYTNLSSLTGNTNIEAISLDYIDEERLSVLSTLTNLKYLHLRNNQQEEILDLSALKSLKVLILSRIKRVENIDFIQNMNNLQTLYIYGINKLYDLTPLSNLTQLKELFLDHGKMSGTGNAVNSIEPLADLVNLEYLKLGLNVENRNYDISPLLKLKKLKILMILPRFLKNGQKELLEKELPLINKL